MKRKHMAAVAAAGLVLASLAGCSSGEKAPETKQETAQTEAATTTGEAQAEAKSEGKKYVVGLAMNTQTNPFFVDVKDGVQKAADELGVELYITDAQDDPAIQMKDVENLITKNQTASSLIPAILMQLFLPLKHVTKPVSRCLPWTVRQAAGK